MIPFPRAHGRRLPSLGRGTGVVAEPGLVPGRDRGERFALLSLDVRGFHRPAGALSSAVAQKVIDRCLRAGVEALARLGAIVELGGTVAHPVIEARFEGEEAPARAARGAVGATDAVRRAQRAEERAFALCGGLAVGRDQTSARGVRVAWGSAPALAARLREIAAPGQLLLGGASWEEWEDELKMVSAPGLVFGPCAAAVPVRALRDLRPAIAD